MGLGFDIPKHDTTVLHGYCDLNLIGVQADGIDGRWTDEFELPLRSGVRFEVPDTDTTVLATREHPTIALEGRNGVV